MNRISKWESFKGIMAKAWKWIKARWYYVAATVVFFVAVAVLKDSDDMQRLYSKLMRKYEEGIRGHQDDLDAVDAARKAERENQRAAREKYEAQVRQIEADKIKADAAVMHEQVHNIQETMNEIAGNPESMAEKVNEEFGLPVRENDKP